MRTVSPLKRGLLDTHPFEKIENFPRIKKSEAPPFHSRSKKLNGSSHAAEPSVLPFIAVGMFAGLRAAERNELNWKDSSPTVRNRTSISRRKSLSRSSSNHTRSTFVDVSF